jgi:hypothetical protein
MPESDLLGMLMQGMGGEMHISQSPYNFMGIPQPRGGVPMGGGTAPMGGGQSVPFGGSSTPIGGGQRPAMMDMGGINPLAFGGMSEQQANRLRQRCMLGDRSACASLERHDREQAQYEAEQMSRRQRTGPALGGGGYGAGVLPMGTRSRGGRRY